MTCDLNSMFVLLKPVKKKRLENLELWPTIGKLSIVRKETNPLRHFN